VRKVIGTFLGLTGFVFFANVEDTAENAVEALVNNL
jgi:hypothetical protein